jgi:hypothetical protein
MFVVRTDLAYKLQPSQPMPKDAVSSLVLEPLDVSNNIVRFDTFASEASVLSSGAEVYELLFQIKGKWKLEPTHAVYASWQVGKPEYEAAFIESRRQLFNVRQRVLHTFTYDWLLKRLNQIGCYLVLGLYGDEDGATRLCREHPAIQQFTRTHPAEVYSAVDLTGLRCFRIEGQTLAAAHPNKA